MHRSKHSHFLLAMMLWLVAKMTFAASFDVAHMPDTFPSDLVGKLRHASQQDCPDFDHSNIHQCEALKLSQQRSMNFGFDKHPHWFVFELNNSSQQDKYIYVDLAYALLDNIDFYVLDKQGNLLESYQTGDSFPFSQRPINNPNFVFPVVIPAQTEIAVRIQVTTLSSLQVPILIWRYDDFAGSKFIETLIFGLFIGAMLVMASYNMILSLSTKDKSYFFCATTLFFYALILSDLTGVSYAFLWPDSPIWNQKSLIIVNALTIASLAIFTQTFLPLKHHSPIIDKLLNAGIALCVLIILVTPFTPYLLLIIWTSFLVATVPFIAYLKSIRLWKLGYPSARYFVIAFSFFVIAVLFFVASKFGFIERNIFTEYSVHFGALIVVIFLSLAIADQLNQDREEKELAQEESIRSLKKYQELYTHSYEGLFQLDEAGRFSAANPACLKMLGASDLAQLQSKFTDFASMVLNDNDKLLDKLKLQENTTNLDVLCQRVDDEHIWINVNTRLSHNSFGQVENIEGSMIDVSVRKDNESRLRYLANYDQLTGLINRNAFQERLRKLIDYARESHSENALLFIDMDRFKLVNDTCGHLAGDELLKQLGVIFTHQVRQRDATARIGGDEFAILLENCDITRASQIGNDLKAALNKFRFNWKGKQFDIGASIGIVPINQYSEGVVSLMNLADSVCLMAKEQGRNRIVVHDEDARGINEKIRAKNLLSTIHDAIENNMFVLYKQNIVALEEPEFVGYEILLRLNLNDEMVSPGVFIPAAERYNVMPKIDRWVIQEFLKILEQNADILKQTNMATVNLSGQTLSNPDFLPFLLSLLKQHPDVSAKLCFELTESAALNNLSESSELVMKMKALGVKFAVDDFGSGYASYSYLTQLPIDFVKIDGSFCENIENEPVNQTVVRSITEISHIMGMKVIAEFVETQGALECLREIGVDMVQGYHLDKPGRFSPQKPET